MLFTISVKKRKECLSIIILVSLNSCWSFIKFFPKYVKNFADFYSILYREICTRCSYIHYSTNSLLASRILQSSFMCFPSD